MKYLNREVEKEMLFEAEGTFEAMYMAQRWIKEQGYDYGATCAMMPVAVMKGNYYEDYDLPHKWKNFSAKERNSVHGVMVGELRQGPVTVYLFTPKS